MTEPTRTTPSRSTAWTIDDVAAYLGCEARTVRRLLATDPTFPPPRKVGRRLLWAPGVVPAWLEASTPATREQPARGRSRSRTISSRGVADRV